MVNLAALLLLLSPAAAPFEGYLPGTTPDHVSVTLVRDARSGRPLEGVTVRRFLEDSGFLSMGAPLLAEARTDEFGLAFVALRGEPTDCHWVFDREGYAVDENYGGFAAELVELKPGRAIRGQLLAPFGRPAGGVAIEAFLGCGHSPAVRYAVTDPEGRFTMRDVDPTALWLWFPTPGITAEYAEATAEPFRIFTLPGIVVTGAVVSPVGDRVPHAVVRSHQQFRGPKTVANAAGEFRLVGVDPREGIGLYAPREDIEAWIDDSRFDLARPVYPVVRRRWNDEEEVEPVRLRFMVVDRETKEDVSDAVIILTREEDGRILFPDDHDPIVEAPPGDYLLRIGTSTSSHVTDPVPFEARAGDQSVHRVEARAQPTLECRARGLPEHGAVLRLLLEDAAESFEIGERVHLPPTARAVVRVDADDHTMLFPVAEGEKTRRVEIDWPAPKRIVLEFDPERTIETHATGEVTIPVHDEELGTQEIRVRIPGEPGAVVRVGRDLLRPPGRITVVRPDGRPPAWKSVRVDGHRLQLDEEGSVSSWFVRNGARVVATADGLAVLRRTLEGDGPYRVEWGGASVDLRPEGERVVYLDGALYPSAQRLDGLDSGPHTLIVSAKGRLGWIVRFELTEGEQRTLELPPLPLRD